MAIAVLASLSYKRWYGGVGVGGPCLWEVETQLQPNWIYILGQLWACEWRHLTERWLLAPFKQTALMRVTSGPKRMIESSQTSLLSGREAPSAWRRSLSSFCLSSSAKVVAYKAIQEFLNQIARLVKLPKRSRGSFALRRECLLNGRLTLTQSAEHSN